MPFISGNLEAKFRTVSNNSSLAPNVRIKWPEKRVSTFLTPSQRGSGNVQRPIIAYNLPDPDSDKPDVVGGGIFSNTINDANQLTDTFVRGGLLFAGARALTDVSRLGQFFITGKGLAMFAKDTLLQATTGRVPNKISNAYTPLSTLAQAAVGFTGTHVNHNQAIPFTSDNDGGGSFLQKIGRPKIGDFRKNLKKINLVNARDIQKAPDYRIGGNNITNPTYIKMGDAGQRKSDVDYSSYTSSSISLDEINAYPIYTADRAKDPNSPNLEIKDLIQFRIAAIDNDKPTNKDYIHFRAYLDGFSDNYQGNWNSNKYLGRGEEFFIYNGFTRTLTLSWTVVAHSRSELIPMYRKLNYLASNLAPDYNTSGHMRGPLIQLTVGGYLYEQPGFITSLTYDINDETSWEIGIDDIGNKNDTISEMPHVIKVTNFGFTPIHRFNPSKGQKNPFISLQPANKMHEQEYSNTLYEQPL